MPKAKSNTIRISSSSVFDQVRWIQNTGCLVHFRSPPSSKRSICPWRLQNNNMLFDLRLAPKCGRVFGRLYPFSCADLFIGFGTFVLLVNSIFGPNKFTCCFAQVLTFRLRGTVLRFGHISPAFKSTLIYDTIYSGVECR